MTRREFAPIMAYMAVAVNCPPPTLEQTTVYFDYLKDRDAGLVNWACRAVVIDHKWPSLPPIGAILRLIVAKSQPAILPADAWAQTLAAVRRYGSGTRNVWHDGKSHPQNFTEIGLASLPPIVARAARAYGWDLLANTRDEDLGKAQHAWLKIYESVREEADDVAMLPESLRHPAAVELGQAFAMAAIGVTGGGIQGRQGNGSEDTGAQRHGRRIDYIAGQPPGGFPQIEQATDARPDEPMGAPVR